ncbi:hypothetical protein LCGC14_1899710 [marine sediment metagenome]|uniref:Uncharacterized protein n=1 Tax=marine sediment metagenome TaxID=412755 RepID=A0A0F9FX76_9ZZZZ
MEKILDYEKGKCFDDFKMYRFQCDCLSAQDAMDINVESYHENKKWFSICLSFQHNSLWERLKYASQIIRGHWTWREFIPREEDYGNISEIFNPDKGYSELP